MASIPKPPTSDLLEELPPKAKQAYLQYLPQLQIDGDFFMFDLPPMVSQPGRWDLIYTTEKAGFTSSLAQPQSN